MPKHSARQKQKQTHRRGKMYKEVGVSKERERETEVRQGGNSNRFGVIRLK